MEPEQEDKEEKQEEQKEEEQIEEDKDSDSECNQATTHIFWPRNLIFGLSDPWDMRKKRIVLFFEIFIL